jgi:hypothetical protein
VLKDRWWALRARLLDKQLLQPPGGTLSLRIPGADAMWFGEATDAAPQRLVWRGTAALVVGAALHASIYRARGDAGAVATGGGTFGRCLADFGGAMPQVFDEQARHLGGMGDAAAGGNVRLMDGLPVCLGSTATRLALNAELFEKCAKAWVLAVATGGRVAPLPWFVRVIANRRLARDQREAARRLRMGLLPEESQGY